jgi:hypothetical protein
MTNAERRLMARAVGRVSAGPRSERRELNAAQGGHAHSGHWTQKAASQILLLCYFSAEQSFNSFLSKFWANFIQIFLFKVIQ